MSVAMLKPALLYHRALRLIHLSRMVCGLALQKALMGRHPNMDAIEIANPNDETIAMSTNAVVRVARRVKKRSS